MSTDIRAALENLLSRLDATTDLTSREPAWVDSYYAARAVLAQPEEGFNHIEPVLSEEYLADAWNQQADEFNQWNSLESSEQLAWAQSRAVAVDRNRRVTPPAPEPGEVGKMVAWLNENADARMNEGYELVGFQFANAATLLQQLAPAPVVVPVPVSERLPGEGDWDVCGMCWMFDPCDRGWWTYRSALPSDDELGSPPWTHWLPAHAIPLPQGGEVQP